MCLSFPQEVEVDDKAVSEGHSRVHASSVTCNGTNLHVHIHSNGSKSVIHTIPVKGTISVIFPVDEELLTIANNAVKKMEPIYKNNRKITHCVR